MGRELRKVQANWRHPVDGDGSFIPLHGRSFQADLADWEESFRQWNLGFVLDMGASCPHENKWKLKPTDVTCSFDEWNGEKPSKKDYMPDWPASERTHLQMYETVTEGTPISPVVRTAEELARVLADDEASYKEWLRFILQEVS